MRGDLQTLILAGKRAGMRVTVVTNGTRPLSGYSPDRFLVSVDGLEEVHDRLRGPGAFRSLLDNLPSARAPKIALVSLCRENRNQIRGLLEFFRDRVDGFWFSFTYDYSAAGNGAPGGGLALDREEQRAAARDLLEAMPSFRIVNSRAFLVGVGTRRPCLPWLMPVYTADGKESGGCVVSAEENIDCDRCELPCHRELSGFVGLSGFRDQLRSYHNKPWL